jgi:hypothetical protein
MRAPQKSAADSVHVSPHDVELAVRVPGFRRVGGLSLGEFVTLQVPLTQSDSTALRVDGANSPSASFTHSLLRKGALGARSLTP